MKKIRKAKKFMAMFVSIALLLANFPGLAIGAADEDLGFTDIPVADILKNSGETDGMMDEGLDENAWEPGDAVDNEESILPMRLGAAKAYAAGEAVRIQETGELFATLAEGIDAAENQGYRTFTLEVIGDVTEAGNVLITSNVTIVGVGVGVDGAHTVALSKSILVQGGGILTLGDGTDESILTFSNTGGIVTVTDGAIYINDGVSLISNGVAVTLTGPNASGAISGGRLEGSGQSGIRGMALSIEKGATISEISGGEFRGNIDAVHLSDTGTKIHLISGGKFSQTDPDTVLHGHALFVQNSSQIGEISGGYFEAARGSAIVVIRGSWIEEISGGEFVSKRVGSYANNDRTGVIWIEGETALTGIGTISGGHFSGGYFALLSIKRNFQTQINAITGGTFWGTVALQNDVGGVITEISGGQFIGSQGMLNVGIIGKIGGQAEFRGVGSYGIYNYQNGQINEISGSAIVSGKDYGIVNAGTIKLISGGTIIGERSAIHCDGLNKGKLETISDGVFWGKNNTAIILAYELTLEPGLTAAKGFGRYWGKDGVIFNNESLVIYPADYWMSIETTPAAGIREAEFKYLTNGQQSIASLIVTVTVKDSYAGADSGAGDYEEGDTVTISAGNRSGYTFSGWTVNEGGVILVNAGEAATTFIMPAQDVIVTANWRYDGGGDSGGSEDNIPNSPEPPIEPPTEPPIEPPAEPPTEPPTVTPPVVKPPQPPDGGALIPGDDGKYIELDKDGTPKGEWHWDEDLSEWVFDENPPLTGLPQAGSSSVLPPLFPLLGIFLTGMGLTLGLGTRQRKSRVK